MRAALPLAGFTSERRRSPVPADPFTLGVASGEPAPDGMVIWTRVEQRGITTAAPEAAHSVHVELTGLRPVPNTTTGFAPTATSRRPGAPARHPSQARSHR
jgi:alkaline phosphatase D